MCFDPGLVGAGEEMLALHRAFGFVLLCLSVRKDRSESCPHLCFGFGETTFAQNTLTHRNYTCNWLQPERLIEDPINWLGALEEGARAFASATNCRLGLLVCRGSRFAFCILFRAGTRSGALPYTVEKHYLSPTFQCQYAWGYCSCHFHKLPPPTLDFSHPPRQKTKSP